jgi:glycerophosphoryl diester phosphodiesterase
MNVEIKPAPGFDEQTGEVVAKLTRHLFEKEIALHIAGTNDNVLPLFASFSFEALRAAKLAAPEIPRGYLVDVIPDDWYQRVLALDAVALHTNHINLSAARAREIKKAGVGLFCYTVNEPSRAKEILSWGVDAFCTDRIDLIGPDFC